MMSGMAMALARAGLLLSGARAVEASARSHVGPSRFSRHGGSGHQELEPIKGLFKMVKKALEICEIKSVPQAA